MVLRSVAVAAVLLAASAFAAGQAGAQYYPRSPYGNAPPPISDDEEPMPGDVPDDGPQRLPSPNPYAPGPDQRYGRSAPIPLDPIGRPPPGVMDRDDPRTYGRAPEYGPGPGYAPPPYGPPPPPAYGPPPPQQYGAVPPGGPDTGPRPPVNIAPDNTTTAALPPDYQPEVGDPAKLPPNLRRQIVDYRTKEPVGTIIIDTSNTYLYLVLANGKALRYGIGVGREGFTWAGAERISKMSEWPDWHPPKEMIERQPYLPRFMAGGPGNPLGARALYLGNTLYRIHGTNQPSTIGSFVSSGCIRLLNEDIEDLYRRVQKGTRVVVLPGRAPPATAQAPQ